MALNRLCLVVSATESTAIASRALELSQAEVDAHPDDAQAQRDLASSVFSTYWPKPMQAHASILKVRRSFEKR